MIYSKEILELLFNTFKSKEISIATNFFTDEKFDLITTKFFENHPNYTANSDHRKMGPLFIDLATPVTYLSEKKTHETKYLVCGTVDFWTNFYVQTCLLLIHKQKLHESLYVANLFRDFLPFREPRRRFFMILIDISKTLESDGI